MRAFLPLSLLLAAALGGPGCDRRSPTPPAGDGSTADGRPAGDGAPIARDGRPVVDGQPASDGPVAAGPCPAALPPANDPCAKAGLICEYGDNPRCLSVAECKQGKWLVAMVKCAPPEPSCPATLAAAAGQGCSVENAYCNYAGLICDCTNCTKYPVEICQGALTWHCETASVTPGCPEARPNLGSPCSPEGLFCEYGCEHNESRKCEGGGWVQASSPQGCPISTRAAKKEIRYLDAEALARIAVAARDLKLATYRYRDPARGRREHLGFILEDSPDVPAADMERRQVDLYAFTSMVLALSQQQQREIAALRREVAALRRQIARPAPAVSPARE